MYDHLMLVISKRFYDLLCYSQENVLEANMRLSLQTLTMPGSPIKYCQSVIKKRYIYSLINM